MGEAKHGLPNDDEVLLQEMFDLIKARVGANPYGSDGLFAEQIRQLPQGLRAMAATHHLDVSLTLDDIGWHFLNFGEANHVKETEAGLRELGLGELADMFHEAYDLVRPHLVKIREASDYYECMKKAGHMDRIDELSKRAWQLLKTGTGNGIYAFWIKYTRAYPERVFNARPPDAPDLSGKKA